jgi:hypothetical protein
MDIERTQVGWRFWFVWVFANSLALAAVGLMGGYGYAMIFTILMYGRHNYDPVLGIVHQHYDPSLFVVAVVVGGVLVGASLGVAQWLLLRQRLSRAAWWILASAVGIAVAAAGWWLLESTAGVAVAALSGVSLGVAQWLVLRRQLSRAAWWILASAVGFAVVFVAFDSSVASAATGAVGVVAYGAITGGVLVLLLRQPDATELISGRYAA